MEVTGESGNSFDITALKHQDKRERNPPQNFITHLANCAVWGRRKSVLIPSDDVKEIINNKSVF